MEEFPDQIIFQIEKLTLKVPKLANFSLDKLVKHGTLLEIQIGFNTPLPVVARNF